MKRLLKTIINRICYKRNLSKKEKFPYDVQAMLRYMRESGKSALSQLTEQEASMFLIRR